MNDDGGSAPRPDLPHFDTAMHRAFDPGAQQERLLLADAGRDEAHREASARSAAARAKVADGDFEGALADLSAAWRRFSEPILVTEVSDDPAFAPLLGRPAFRLFEAAALTSRSLQEGDAAEALALVQRAVALAPEYIPAYVRWERLASEHMDPRAAQLATMARLRIPRETANALCFWLERILHDEAARPELVVDRLARDHPDDPVALFHRARWLAHRGLYAEACEALARVVRLQPETEGDWLREELADYEEFDGLVESEHFTALLNRLGA